MRVEFGEGEHRYRHVGPRGNVRFVTDATGAVVAHHVYGPYGHLTRYGPEAEARG